MRTLVLNIEMQQSEPGAELCPGPRWGQSGPGCDLVVLLGRMIRVQMLTVVFVCPSARSCCSGGSSACWGLEMMEVSLHLSVSLVLLKVSWL